MIRSDHYLQALRALQRLIVHAKSQAFAAGQSRVAELLNDVELLPEFIADERDRTGDFLEMLEGIVQLHPSCQYIVDDFEQSSPAMN
jgi:hypothetical protein